MTVCAKEVVGRMNVLFLSASSYTAPAIKSHPVYSIEQ